MKKSVYSLVLMDDVIKAVDQQAYRMGTSRSNLINQILAEHLSCVTPEMRMREIFGQVAELVSSSFRVQEQRSPSLMTVRTALEYKYRPTINYKVELVREPAQYIGMLKVSIRTQNEKLIGMFEAFFTYRHYMEASYLVPMGISGCCYGVNNGCFSRSLLNTEMMSEQQIGEAIGEYIKNLDHDIKMYFADPISFREKQAVIEENYRRLLEKYII